MVLEDNRDNGNNGKNGRNCGCHEVTYNRDNFSVYRRLVVTVAFGVCLKRRSACKAVLSEASVTRDKVPGLDGWRLLSERQYLAICIA